VTAMDVVYALKRQGRTLYGFGGWGWSLFCRPFYNGVLEHHLFFVVVASNFIRVLWLGSLHWHFDVFWCLGLWLMHRLLTDCYC
jgi:hypothetical protein